MNDALLMRAREIDEDAWFGLLDRSVAEPVIEGMSMPRFPDEELQRKFVGSSGQAALGEAKAFYRIVKKAALQVGRPLRSGSAVLDFGCGWGRMIRLFLRDVDAQDLVGVDVLPDMVTLCRGLNLRARFEPIEPEPPSQFGDASFDVVYAYSVFSHLSEPIHQAWVREFARTIKPGGVLVVTTHSRRFIRFCSELRDRDSFESAWHEALARSFMDTDGALTDYDAGRFVYAPTSGGPGLPAERSGEAVVSPGYVKRMWAPYFEILDFVDDKAILPQAYVVARRR